MDNRFYKTAYAITGITIFSKILGFIRETLLAYFFGASYAVDAYLMASSIPDIFLGWLTCAAVAFIPAYSSIVNSEGRKAGTKYLNLVNTYVIIIGIIFSVFGMIFAPKLVEIAAPGFNSATTTLTITYLRVTIWISVLLSVVRLMMSFLECNQKFIQSAISNLFFSSVQSITIILCAKFGVQYLAYGLVLNYICQLIYLYIISSRLDYHFKPCIRKIHWNSILIRSIVPIYFSTMISEINLYFDRFFASLLHEGSVSILNYAVTISVVLFYICGNVIITISFPQLSKLHVEQQRDAFSKETKKGFLRVVTLMLPITVLFIIVASPVISVLFERGSFDAQNTDITAKTLQMYLIGLLPLTLIQYLSKVLHSQNRSKAVLLPSIISMVCNVLFNALLVRRLHTLGLALGTSFASWVSLAFTILISFRRTRTKIDFLRGSGKAIGQILISSSIMALCVLFTHYLFTNMSLSGFFYHVLEIVCCSILGFGTFFFSGKILRSEEIRELNNSILCIFHRRNNHREKVG